MHRAPAAAKAVVAGGVVLTTVLLPRGDWVAYAGVGAALVLVAAIARLPPGRLLVRLLLLEPFVFGVAALMLLQPHGGARFAAMVTRSTLALTAMILLAATTRFSDIVRVLWRAKVPPTLVTSLALMARYLDLLVDEAGRMHRARASRSFRSGRRQTWWTSATVAAHLFLRTSERAERIFDAMCARGWTT